jgi:hypothetical protein
MIMHDDDQDRDSKDNTEGRREPTRERMTSRSRKVKPAGKKRRLPRGARAHARKQGSRASRAGTMRSAERGPAPEPPPIMPQPSIESYEEGSPEGQNRPEQEPPPPTASAQQSGLPGGDADDLFEYVF